MQLLVLFCHPTRESFAGSILSALEPALSGQGHGLQVIDLYAEGFDPALDAARAGAPTAPARAIRPPTSRRSWPRCGPPRDWC